MEKRPKVRFNMTLNHEILEELRKIGADEERSLSNIVNQIIKAEIARRKAVTNDEKSKD